jgi:hypothetical protein
MAALSFALLTRSYIGFGRVPMLLSRAMQRDESGYPP